MKKVLIAGSTGYLGRHLLKQLIKHHLPFQAITRNERKLFEEGLNAEQIIKAEITDPLTLKGKMKNADVLISTVGITRQKDGLSYMDVDYQANINLLREAQAAGVQKYIYVSVINGNHLRHLKLTEAKERFVDALKASGMDYLIIRPNGFFSDMKDFLDMAKKGRVYLFGNGEYKLNPIHGADLAKVILESIDSNKKELIIGGPDVLTQNEIAKLALQSWRKSMRITHLPDISRKLFINLLRLFTSSKFYGPVEFFLEMSAQDNVAPRYGIHRLKDHFRQEVDRI